MSTRNMASTPFHRRSSSGDEKCAIAVDMNSPPTVLERHLQQQMLEDHSYVQCLDQQLRAQREDSTAQAHPIQSRSLKLKFPEEFSESGRGPLQMLPAGLNIASVCTPREQCPECMKISMTTPTNRNSSTKCPACASRERHVPAEATFKSTTPQSYQHANVQQNRMPIHCRPANNPYFASNLPSQASTLEPDEGRIATAPGLNLESKMDEEGQDYRIQLRPRTQISQSLLPEETPPQSLEHENETTLTVSVTSSQLTISLAPRAHIPRSVSAPLLPLCFQSPT